MRRMCLFVVALMCVFVFSISSCFAVVDGVPVEEVDTAGTIDVDSCLLYTSRWKSGADRPYELRRKAGVFPVSRQAGI